jgi:hypothetical protein
VSKTSASPIRFSWDAFLQRLFSTFPNSWPGVGLLLFRVCLGVALMYFSIAGLSGAPSEPIILAQNSIAAVGAIFLLAGLWTPVMGTLTALAGTRPVEELNARATAGPHKQQAQAQTLADAERAPILAVLKETDWIPAGANGAAARLGMNRSTLRFRMKRLGIAGPASA